MSKKAIYDLDTAYDNVATPPTNSSRKNKKKRKHERNRKDDLERSPVVRSSSFKTESPIPSSSFNKRRSEISGKGYDQHDLDFRPSSKKQVRTYGDATKSRHAHDQGHFRSSVKLTPKTLHIEKRKRVRSGSRDVIGQVDTQPVDDDLAHQLLDRIDKTRHKPQYDKRSASPSSARPRLTNEQQAKKDARLSENLGLLLGLNQKNGTFVSMMAQARGKKKSSNGGPMLSLWLHFFSDKFKVSIMLAENKSEDLEIPYRDIQKVRSGLLKIDEQRRGHLIVVQCDSKLKLSVKGGRRVVYDIFALTLDDNGPGTSKESLLNCFKPQDLSSLDRAIVKEVFKMYGKLTDRKNGPNIPPLDRMIVMGEVDAKSLKLTPEIQEKTLPRKPTTTSKFFGEPSTSSSSTPTIIETNRPTRSSARLGGRSKKRFPGLRESQMEKMVFTYPFEGTKDEITVRNTDLTRTEDCVYLNDTIIDFYIRYQLTEGFCQEPLPKRNREEEWRKRKEKHGDAFGSVFAFSSLFLKRMLDFKKDNRSATEEESYKNVQRWGKKVELFEKKVLIVPINDAQHWSLIIVVNADQIPCRIAKAYLDAIKPKSDSELEIIETRPQQQQQQAKEEESAMMLVDEGPTAFSHSQADAGKEETACVTKETKRLNWEVSEHSSDGDEEKDDKDGNEEKDDKDGNEEKDNKDGNNDKDRFQKFSEELLHQNTVENNEGKENEKEESSPSTTKEDKPEEEQVEEKNAAMLEKDAVNSYRGLIDEVTAKAKEGLVRPEENEDSRKKDSRVSSSSSSSSSPVSEKNANDSKSEEFHRLLAEYNRKNDKERPPEILFMDSLGSHRIKTMCRLIEIFLKYAVLHRVLKPTEDDKVLKKVVSDFKIPMQRPNAPSQQNSYDCGVYVLLYVESFLRDWIIRKKIKLDDVSNSVREVINKKWFHASHSDNFRESLARLLKGKIDDYKEFKNPDKKQPEPQPSASDSSNTANQSGNKDNAGHDEGGNDVEIIHQV